MEPSPDNSPPPAAGRRMPRDSRDSLEVFNPSAASYSFRPTNPVFRSPSTWQSWNDAPEPVPAQVPDPGVQRSEEITSWMALTGPVITTISADGSGKQVPGAEGGTAEERAAEWGLMLRTDTETGKPQGVTARTSGGDEQKAGTSRRNSNNSVRSSGGESSDDGGRERGFPRVSEDLKDALSTFQQTFVVSDATKPDYPILYASAGFFQMTGYTSKEVIGRNCMQVEVSKHTEGSKEKTVRPNGLPESLIRYDERQKNLAASSVSELVQAVKRPRALSESAYHPRQSRKRSSGGREAEALARKSLEHTRRNSRDNSRRSSMQCISEVPEKKPRKATRFSFMGSRKKDDNALTAEQAALNEKVAMCDENELEEEDVSSEDERPESMDDRVKQKEKRKGIDLATTLERIEKNFVITDPRLPDNPIIFASDSFLELTEYSREEILGRNCRFLQGPETDPATVRKIREAIDNQTDVTVQLINYTKSGKKFWNLFHLQAMRDQKGEVQYFIGVQLDGSQHVEPLHNCIPEDTAKESEKLVKATAENVGDAAKELPDANLTPEDLWINHSKTVHPKPHRKDCPSWRAIQEILDRGEQIGLKHFKPIKPLGSGDTGSVHLVELCGTSLQFAMKAMDKSVMLNRNKVHRACAEREILDKLDHPFLPALYASFQTKTHICLITDYCPGGELFMLLDRQPTKVLKEDAVRFYAAEVIIALEYLHCQGIIYRDLKPENILLQGTGHVALTDFDLSCLTSCKPELIIPDSTEKKKQKGQKNQQIPIFMAEPMRASNSFVGTEEYIAPEIITGAGHTSAVDWWALGILLYEMFYGFTPFRGKTRQKTFANVIHKDLKFPASKSASISLHAKQLMYQLLHRDPKHRLGSREGANEIKNHPFFRGINWALVRSTNPPELDAPLFGTDEEKLVTQEMQDLQLNVF